MDALTHPWTPSPPSRGPRAIEIGAGARLAPWVESAWYLDGAPTGGGLVIPDGRMDLVCEWDDDGYPRTPMVLGNQTRPRLWKPASAAVGIRFRPEGAATLLGIGASALTNRVTPLEQVWSRTTVVRLADRVTRPPTADARARALLGEMEDRLRQAPLPPAPIRAAVAAVEDGRGRVHVNRLAAGLQTSRQHLTRLFRRHVGIAPTVLSRVARLQRALVAVPKAGPAGWAGLAGRAGYCDQSHLIREFIALTGRTPESWRVTGATWYADCTAA